MFNRKAASLEDELERTTGPVLAIFFPAPRKLAIPTLVQTTTFDIFKRYFNMGRN